MFKKKKKIQLYRKYVDYILPSDGLYSEHFR